MQRWVALGVMAILLAGGIYLFTRPSSHPNAAFAEPAAAGRPIPTGDAAPPLVAPVGDVSPATKEARRFNRYDKDRDGEITRDEYLLSRRKAYAKLDLDGDGKLSFDEYSAKAIKKFAAADASRDAILTPVEFATTAVKRRARVATANCPPVEAEVARDEEG